MTALRPVFTVIMATWGRGRHILPSITSVLQQDFPDFELIVAGDACTDETEAVVTAIKDPRVRWINLTTRCGSQSAPNNAGIAAARGSIIAYLGHDDIWERSHLSAVLRGFQATPRPDFVVSGVICHLPNGLDGCPVFGLLPDDAPIRRHPLPPSCFAHDRTVPKRIGPWQIPSEIRAPVDQELLQRAEAAGLRFRSTGQITVHKFSAADRYLCYLCQDAKEQQAMLGDLDVPRHARRVAEIVADARVQGTYMREYAMNFDNRKPGELLRNSIRKRGLLTPKLVPLRAGAVIRQRPDFCALDWRDKPIFGVRFHARNPKPRFLLPFSATGPVSLAIRVVHFDRAAFAALTLRCNHEVVTVRPRNLRHSLWGWTALFETGISLQADSPSLLELHLTHAQQQRGRAGLGFGIGKIRLLPL